MPTVSQTIDSRLLAANIAIQNSLNDADIKDALALFGYDETRLNDGQSLYTTAVDKVQKQKKEYGEQYAATDALNSSMESANLEYMRHVKIARIAFKDNRAVFQALGLNGDRKRSVSGWLSQVKQFYANAQADTAVQEGLNRFGITLEKLQAASQLVNQVETAYAVQNKEMGEAQQATLDRDNALDSLDEWLSDFFAIARIALEDRPQLLEKIGLLVRSE